MKNKKTKLTISENAKKSISNIELAKTQNKNSEIIEKKTSRFGNRGSFSKSTTQNTAFKKRGYANEKPTNFLKPTFSIRNDDEKRKLAEQRATRRLKGDSTYKDFKKKLVLKKEN